MNNKLLRGLGVGGLVVFAASSCVSTNDPGTEETSNDSGKDGGDIQLALDALPSAQVVDVDAHGIPTFVVGQLGRMAALENAKALSELGPTMGTVGKVFRASAADLVLKSTHTDTDGDQHFHYTQLRDGLGVLGGELAVHVRGGAVLAANGSARADLPAPKDPKIEGAEAIVHAKNDSSHVSDLQADASPRLAYKLGDGKLDMVYVVKVTGKDKNGTPVLDDVVVNAADGSVMSRISHIHTAKNRELHDAKHGTSTPGALVRTEGAAEVADAIVNTNYDRLGSTYDCYKTLFNRDSFDNKGAKLISTVHFDNNYVNAYWDGTQMVYGDGDGVQASSLAASMDVTAHELTHAVTERTSGLVYSGESGGLNEAMSDIFGNTCEWFRDTAGDTTKAPTANNFLVGEDVWTPGKAGDALRYMADPLKDGYSLDLWTSSTKNAEVHSSSGIGNLAFYLMAQGGKHPRNKTTVTVTGIGILKAAQVFYKANTSIMTANSNYAAARTATEQAAVQLGLTAAEQASVSNAWAAVGVGQPAGGGGGGGGNPPPPTGKVLTNGTAVTASGAAASETVFTLDVAAGSSNLTFTTAGGTGDVDLYVKFGAAPTTTTYDCRPYKNGNAETCTIAAPAAGTYYVMLKGYAQYANVSLTGKFTTGGGNPPPSSCAHSKCTTGAALKTGCDPCVDSIIAKDPFCKNSSWDAQCVSEVASICKLSCP